MTEDFIPFSLPFIEEEEIEAVTDTLRSGWITTGPKTREFEREFAAYVGCKHAVAVNSCTAALHLALDAVGIKEGDEVITSPMTFAATAEVVRYFNAKPLFVDIDPVTMNIDVNKLADEIERRHASRRSKGGGSPNFGLKAVIPVHYAGYPCDMDSVMKVAAGQELKVIEDAAHALPSYYKGRMIGSTGDIACFSFYATKNITTGEGGMVTTDNDDWAERMRIMSLHGISKDAWKRYTAEGSWYYEITAPGYKYNLTDIAASLGIVQLRKSDIFWRRRAEIAGKYNEAFAGLEELELPPSDLDPRCTPGTRQSWHLYVIRLNLDRLSIGRNRFIEELRARGIGTSVHFIPLHIHPYYRGMYGYEPEDFPVAYGTYQRIVSLPIYPRMTDVQVERVIEAVVTVVKKFGR